MVTSVPEERKMFRIIPLHYAIFDEAHMLKNMYTQRYENLIKINVSQNLFICTLEKKCGGGDVLDFWLTLFLFFLEKHGLSVSVCVFSGSKQNTYDRHSLAK